MKEELFLYGGVNKDTTVLEKGDYLDASGLTNYADKSTYKDRLEIVLGNLEIAGFTFPSGTNKVIGSCKDETTQSIYYFIYNSNNFHSILRYNTLTKVIQKIVWETTTVSKVSALDFELNPDSFAAVYFDGQLIFNSKNVLKSIDVEKAFNFSNPVGTTPQFKYSSFTSDIISFIKSPPKTAPNAVYGRDETYLRNNLRGKMFQFAYRYIYQKNEISVLSDVSNLPLPQNQEKYNGEFVTDYYFNNTLNVMINTGNAAVKRIEIFARQVNILEGSEAVLGRWYKVHTIDKYNAFGNITVPSNTDYSYAFHNDTLPIAEDQQDLLRPFDYVPIEAKTLSLLDGNKIIVGDYTEGYNSIVPNVTLSLTSELIDSGENGIPNAYDFTSYLVSIDSTESIYSYYAVMVLPLTVTAGNVINIEIEEDGTVCSISHTITASEALSVNYPTLLNTNLTNELIAEGINIPTNIDPVHDNPYYLKFFSFEETYPIGTDPDTVQNIATLYGWIIDEVTSEVSNTYKYPVFKKGSYHEFGLVYKDSSKRKGTANTNEAMKIYIPFDSEATYTPLTTNSLLYKVNYTIKHAPPSWATRYAWVYFPNSTLIDYYQFWYHVNYRNIPTPSLSKKNDIFKNTDNRYHIYINNQIKNQNEKFPGIIKEYTWKKGDRIRFIGSFSLTSGEITYLSDYVDLEIWGDTTDEDGNYAIILQDWSPSTAYYNSTNDFKGVIYEIYTPASTIENKIGYEIEQYPIINGYHGTNGVNQSSGVDGTGYFTVGNSYMFSRNLELPAGSDIHILMESKHFSDYYNSNVYSFGDPNVVSNTFRQKRFFSGLRYGQQAIQGSLINGISTFIYDDFHILSESNGNVTHIENVGDTLKVRQQYRSTSFYIGKQFLKSADGSDIPVESVDRILGAKNTSMDSYGLQYPYSYVRHNRSEYFFDVRNGVVIRDAANGMFPISSYGMASYFKELAKTIRSKESSSSTRYKIISSYDQQIDCYILTISDPVSNATETWMFNESTNRWKGRLPHKLSTVTPEWYEYLGDSMVSFMAGKLYLHHAGNPATFYGVYNNPWIKVKTSMFPSVVKVFNAIEVNSTCEWEAPLYSDVIIPKSLTYKRMTSRLKDGRWKTKEGLRYAAFLRNATSTSDTPTQDELFNGEVLRGLQMEVRLETSSTTQETITNINIEML